MPRLSYSFEEIDESELARMPLAALRALRVAGVALSRAGWEATPLEARRELCVAGAREAVIVPEVQRILEKAPLDQLRLVPRISDPSLDQVPPDLAGSLGPGRSLPLPLWQQMSGLDRHVLAMCARNTRLAWRAIAEITLRLRYPGAVLPPGAWTGILAHCEVSVSVEVVAMLRSVQFHDGRALVLSRVAGIRAARWASEILDLHAGQATGPVEVGYGIDPRGRAGAVIWQSHVSTIDGQFSPSASMLAAVTAAAALHDIVTRAGAPAVIEAARLVDEPWMISDQDDDITLGF